MCPVSLGPDDERRVGPAPGGLARSRSWGLWAGSQLFLQVPSGNQAMVEGPEGSSRF